MHIQDNLKNACSLVWGASVGLVQVIGLSSIRILIRFRSEFLTLFYFVLASPFKSEKVWFDLYLLTTKQLHFLQLW